MWKIIPVRYTSARLKRHKGLRRVSSIPFSNQFSHVPIPRDLTHSLTILLVGLQQSSQQARVYRERYPQAAKEEATTPNHAPNHSQIQLTKPNPTPPARSPSEAKLSPQAKLNPYALQSRASSPPTKTPHSPTTCSADPRWFGMKVVETPSAVGTTPPGRCGVCCGIWMNGIIPQEVDVRRNVEEAEDPGNFDFFHGGQSRRLASKNGRPKINPV